MSERFEVYHAHGIKRIGEAKTLEAALATGEKYGCRDYDCPCRKYMIYDNALLTGDMDVIIKHWVKRNTT